MFCQKCGASIEDGGNVCPSCGAEAASAQTQPVLNNDVSDNVAMGILAYLGFLVLVPIFAAKDSKFARFHANQGLVLFIGEVAYGIIAAILLSVFSLISWSLAGVMGTIFGLVWILWAVLAIIGIINACKGEEKPLPVIGGIKLLK